MAIGLLAAGLLPVQAQDARMDSLQWLRAGPEELTGSGAPGYLYLAFPNALASRGGYVYIADSGLGRVVRYDLATGRYAKLMPAGNSAQLAIGADLSLYVLDPACQCVRRYSRSGQQLQAFADALNLVAPVDLALDERRNVLWVLDGTYGQLVGFNPFGRVMRVLSLARAGLVQGMPVAMARTAGGFLVIDRGARRVLALDEEGRVTRTLGQDTLGDPIAVVQDSQGRILVAARASQTITRVWPAPVEALIPYRPVSEKLQSKAWMS